MKNNSEFANFSDQDLLLSIQSTDDRRAFHELYRRFFDRLFNYIYPKIHEKESTQDIIQDLFVNLWQRRKGLSIENIDAYLIKASKNLIISNYRKKLAREKQEAHWASDLSSDGNFTLENIMEVDLNSRYQQGLELLPEKCQKVFVLSRNGFTNREVAIQMGISEKTVEQHITKALRVLRLHLKDHLAYSLLVFPWLYA